jgi:hypothetical protein
MSCTPEQVKQVGVKELPQKEFSFNIEWSDPALKSYVETLKKHGYSKDEIIKWFQAAYMLNHPYIHIDRKQVEKLLKKNHAI